MILSQIASAIVGSPMTSCQEDTGNWLVIIVEAILMIMVSLIVFSMQLIINLAISKK